MPDRLLVEVGQEKKLTKPFIDKAIERVDREVFAPLKEFICFGPNPRAITEVPCNRLRCLNSVTKEDLEGNDRVEKFFKGLGQFFFICRDGEKTEEQDFVRPDMPDFRLVTSAVYCLNRIVEEVRTEVSQAFALELRSLRLTKPNRRIFLEKLFGPSFQAWGIVPLEEAFAVIPGSVYTGGSFPLTVPTSEFDILEALISAERRVAEANSIAAKSATAAAEARHGEATALMKIGELRQEVSQLTKLTCDLRGNEESAVSQELSRARNEISRLTKLLRELRAENEGLRAYVSGSDVSRSNPVDPLPETEKFPVGQGIDPLKWLEDHYGHRLRFFGAPEDTVFQDDLRHADWGLLKALSNKLYYEKKRRGSGQSLREIIPTREDRNTKRVAAVLAVSQGDPALLTVARHRASRRR